MDKDFNELIEYLDKKFNETAKKEKVDERFGKIDERFNKVDERFNRVDEKFEKLFDIFATKEDLKEAVANLPTKEDFINLQTSVDAYAKKADTFFQEMVALAHKVDRHEKWILQIAEKLGVKLEY